MMPGFNVLDPRQQPQPLTPMLMLHPEQLAAAAQAAFRPPSLMPTPSLSVPQHPPAGIDWNQAMGLAGMLRGGIKDFLTGRPYEGDPLASIIYGSPRPPIINLGGGWIGGGV
jgi:hypothetical protein